MSDDDLKKAEPSRWHTGSGHFPTFSAHKLRAIAASGMGELNAMQREVSRMSRTQSEAGAYDASIRPAPHVVTIEDVTRGLGLDFADAARVQRHVSETSPAFSQKTQTQRIYHARSSLLSLLRDSMRRVDADTRGELVRRAVVYWKRHYQTDYGVAPTIRFRGGGTVEKSMREEPIPVLTIERVMADPRPALVIPLEKATGGKYYRRIPTGNPKRPWRYFYSKASYERAHGKDGHLNGPEVLASRRGKRKKPRQLGFDFGGPEETAAPDAPPAPKSALPPAIAKVAPEQLEAEVKAIADELGLKSEVYVAAHQRKHALFGTAHDIVVRSKGRALKEGKKLLEQIRERWFASGPLNYTEERFGAHGGSAGYADGTSLVLRVWPDVAPGSTSSDIQLREDAGRVVAPGDPDRGRELAAQVIEAARVGGSGGHGITEQIVTSGDFQAIHAARAAVNSAYQAAKATLKEISKIKTTWRVGTSVRTSYGIRSQTDHPRYSEYLEAVRSEHALKAAWHKLDKALTRAPPSPPEIAEPKTTEPKLVVPNAVDRFEAMAGKDQQVDGVAVRVRTGAKGRNWKTVHYEVGRHGRGSLIVLNAGGGRWSLHEVDGMVSMGSARPGVQIGLTSSPEEAIALGAKHVLASSMGAKGPPSSAAKPPQPAKAPRGTPRGEAQRESARAEVNGDYLNDRVSAVPNAGEDIKGTARHRAIAWKGLQNALGSADAGKLFTRSFLEREKPHELVAKTQQGADPTSALFLHFLSRKFPSKPPKLASGRGDELGTWFVNQGAPTGYMAYGGHRAKKLAEYRAMSAEQKTALQSAYAEDQRAGYFAAYETLHSVIEKHASLGSSGDFRAFTRAVRRDLAAAMTAAGGREGSSSSMTFDIRGKFQAKALRKVINQGWRGKTSATSQVGDVVRRIQAERVAGLKGDTPLDLLEDGWSKGKDQAGRFREVSMTIMGGTSVKAAFGDEAKKTRRFDVTEAYDTDVMSRSGPPSEYHSVQQALDTLVGSSGGKYGLRAVNFGKYVPDGEREHHLKSTLDSFQDLTDALGLPPQMASFNGKLGFLIGADGRGNTLAHYDAMKVAINLTRAGGAGSLAHEWGHFFDYTIAKITPGPGRVRGIEHGAFELSPNEAGSSSTQAAMSALHASDAYRGFSQRITGVAYGRFGEKAAQYWSSHRELFARGFERYLQRKLQKAGRKNTYLTAVKKSASQEDGLWPTDKEVDAMTPHFDAVFKAFREGDLLRKAVAWVDRVRPEYSRFVGGNPMFVVSRGR